MVNVNNIREAASDLAARFKVLAEDGSSRVTYLIGDARLNVFYVPTVGTARPRFMSPKRFEGDDAEVLIFGPVEHTPVEDIENAFERCLSD